MKISCATFTVLAFSGWIYHHLHENSVLVLFLGINRRRTVTLWLRSQITLQSLAILYTTSALLFIVIGGVAPTSHSLGGCECKARQMQGLSFHAHAVRECFFALQLAFGLSDSRLLLRPGSLQRLWSAGTNEMSPFCKNSFSLLCMHTLQRNTQCSYNLTLAEHWGCCQNLFNSSTPSLPTNTPLLYYLLQVKEPPWTILDLWAGTLWHTAIICIIASTWYGSID